MSGCCSIPDRSPPAGGGIPLAGGGIQSIRFRPGTRNRRACLCQSFPGGKGETGRAMRMWGSKVSGATAASVSSSGEEVAGFVALYQQSTWLEFLAAFKPIADQFLARFQEIANAGPAEDQDVLQSMIKHEKSFVDWIEKETAGEEGSLDAAISQLQYPLAAP